MENKIQDQHGSKYFISDKNAAAYLRVTDLSPVGQTPDREVLVRVLVGVITLRSCLSAPCLHGLPKFICNQKSVPENPKNLNSYLPQIQSRDPIRALL